MTLNFSLQHEAAKSKYLDALNRIDQELQAILKWMQSSKCEPTTQRLFLQLQAFRRQIDMLQQRNNDFLNDIKTRGMLGTRQLGLHLRSIQAFQRRIRCYKNRLC